ncbi:MAG: AMP-binding protein [Acidobacteriia bacterium]|nr:AMP-binding protein [Terriglobia bacterium]
MSISAQSIPTNPLRLRTELYADPAGVFVHDAVLSACRKFDAKTAFVDTSYAPARRISYGSYGELVERIARGLVASGVRPGDRVAILLPNTWEFAATSHAAMLAGATPSPLNPSYKEREVRYQLENSGARVLVSDGSLISGMNLEGLPELRRVYTTRNAGAGASEFSELLRVSSATLPSPEKPPEQTLAALPYSSGTTGLPKGVMLTHYNLVVNVYQLCGPGAAPFTASEVGLCFLPLYHIYGLNVVLNPCLMLGCTLVLMPRFDAQCALRLIAEEGITFVPVVPPVLNLFCQAAEKGEFPRDHRIKWVKSGAAPLAPELAKRFTSLTGVKIAQGYGMTEASPVTHVGFEHGPLYNPTSIGQPVALTDCRLLGESENEVGAGEIGELVMRGPQFMLGYWNAPQATGDVLREGWYYSGDVARRDENGLYYIVDRRKEMIKYKGFPVAPAEVESVLLEHPAVRDCGVVGKKDDTAGEIPCAFIVLREGFPSIEKTKDEICGYVGERLTGYKQPREVKFITAIPRNPSGKILRRELRKIL